MLAKGVWESRNDRMDAATFNESMTRLKSEDGVDAAMQALLDSVPELVQPLVHERDLYMAWSMKRSKAVNGTTQVVGVVGKGHLKGANVTAPVWDLLVLRRVCLWISTSLCVQESCGQWRTILMA